MWSPGKRTVKTSCQSCPVCVGVCVAVSGGKNTWDWTDVLVCEVEEYIVHISTHMHSVCMHNSSSVRTTWGKENSFLWLQKVILGGVALFWDLPALLCAYMKSLRQGGQQQKTPQCRTQQASMTTEMTLISWSMWKRSWGAVGLQAATERAATVSRLKQFK